MHIVTVREAKNNWTRLLNDVETGNPMTITRRGVRSAVMRGTKGMESIPTGEAINMMKAKINISSILDAIEKGEHVLITKNDTVVACLEPVPVSTDANKRPNPEIEKLPKSMDFYRIMIGKMIICSTRWGIASDELSVLISRRANTHIGKIFSSSGHVMYVRNGNEIPAPSPNGMVSIGPFSKMDIFRFMKQCSDYSKSDRLEG